MRLVDSASCLLATRVAVVQIQYHNHTVCQEQWGKVFTEPEFCFFLYQGQHNTVTWGTQNERARPTKYRNIGAINEIGRQRELLACLLPGWLQFRSNIITTQYARYSGVKYFLNQNSVFFCIRANTILCHGGHRMRELSQQNAEILEESIRLVNSTSCLLAATRVALVQIQYLNHTVCQVQCGRIIYESTTFFQVAVICKI